ncbi:uncharacterized protein [Erythrolamprus reginae]|uniref:uncharacterized protein isoform X1 n=1 Tax=Erythrolamprus reginae TaxID=121349 RepID=UPI00396C322C
MPAHCVMADIQHQPAIGAGGEAATRQLGALLSPRWLELRVRGPTPIKLDRLRDMLRGFHPKKGAEFLVTGFSEGFRIPYKGPRIACLANNLKSVVGMEHVVREKIMKEVREGRVLGPFTEPPLPSLQVSPLGVVPKRAAGEFRLIHHLSFPPGNSVNDHIPDDLCSVRYTSFDTAVSVVRECGPGALMGKCDIKSAFRLLPIHPEDFDLLGFQFEGGFFVDRALPMGCSVSCSLFEKFSSFLEWAHVKSSGIRSVVHYLDDFLFAGPAGSDECQRGMAGFQGLCGDLGVPLAHEKTEGPTTRLTFLGIEVDSVAQTCRLPEDKLVRLRDTVRVVRAARRVTLRQVQELAGLLNFACRVIAPGRAFMFRLYQATVGLTKPHHRIRLTASVRKDLGVWQDFLHTYNGVSFWRQDMLLKGDFQVKSDAAGAVGFGVVWKDKWFRADWPQEWQGTAVCRDLTFLELFPIVVAIELWSTSFTGRGTTGGTPPAPVADWRADVNRAIDLSIAASTRRSYQRAGREFWAFRHDRRYDQLWPAPVEHLLEFCSLSKRQGLSARTIRGKLAGLAFIAKSRGFSDNTGDFRIRKALEGWLREKGPPQGDRRRPLKLAHLRGLSDLWDKLCHTQYEAALYRTVAVTLFFGAFRISEVLAASKSDHSGRALTARDIRFRRGAVFLRLRFSKTDQRGRGVTVQLSRTNQKKVCPVGAISAYWGARGSYPGPLFCHASGDPLTRYQFWAVTTKALARMGLDPKLYGTHSFRIGAASFAAEVGFSPPDIRAVGRWRSTAFRAYIRP